MICKNTCDGYDRRGENKLFYHVAKSRHVYVIGSTGQSGEGNFDRCHQLRRELSILVPSWLCLERICGCIFHGYFTEISGYPEKTQGSRMMGAIRKYDVLAPAHKFFASKTRQNAVSLAQSVIRQVCHRERNRTDKAISFRLRQPSLFNQFITHFML